MNKKRTFTGVLGIVFLLAFFLQFFTVESRVFASTITSTSMTSLKPYTSIDSLTEGMIVDNKDILLEGWSLSALGIKEIKVYLDNNYIGSTNTGLSRPDVNAAFPGYVNGDKSGFRYTINKNIVSTGKHQVKLVAIGNDTVEYIATRSFSIKKPEPYTCIDSLKGDDIINNTDILLQGWSLNPSGVKEMKVFVDNNYLGNSTVGISRPDVGTAFPMYTGGANSGFKYVINKNLLSIGTHEVKLVATGNDGSEYSTTTKLTLRKPEPYTNVDNLRDGMVITNKDIDVQGWSLSPAGVKEMKIHLDDTYIGNATIGISRPDVAKAFPAYLGGSNSGFKFNIDKNMVAPGQHTIKLTTTGNDGTIYSSTVKFYLDKPAPYTHIDTLKNGEVINNKDLTVNGWSLNASGVKEIKVFIDGVHRDNATIGISRPDVGAAFPAYTNSSNSGFNLVIDKNTIGVGSHTLVIEAYGVDGSVNKTSTNFTMTKPSPYTLIESVSDKQVINSDTLTISGWALNAAGVTTVQVYVDGIYNGDATLGLSRADVGTAYPQYTNSANSGFSYKLDTLKLSVGSHVIKLISYAKDGTAYINTFSIVNNGIVVNYNYTNSNLDYWVNKEVQNQSNVTWGRGPATFDEIKYYMNPKNFINDPNGKYMFLRLTYVDGISVNDLNKLLVGKGVLEGKGDVFLRAAKEANINPIYLISHALLETGNGKSMLSNGISVSVLHKKVPTADGGYEVVVDRAVEPRVTYNMFGIGAYDSDANMWGSETAYKEGWFSVDSAILGGAKWIASGYIANPTYKQNTLYKMKWNLTENYMWHQYATDVAWAYKQTLNIKKLVDQMDKPILIFDIPVLN